MSASTGTAQATFIYGQISFVSLTSDTLCLSVPITVSNTGSGRIYAVQIHLFIGSSITFSAKTPLAVAPHASKSLAFTMCGSGYNGPPDGCNSMYLLSGGEYWGDPDPALAGMAGTPTKTVSYCIPRG